MRQDALLHVKYWPTLDTVRIVAALAVVVYHARDLLPTWLPVPNGEAAVRLFFALSGFLITLLLMREREGSGSVDVRAFYIRRALRILPLYVLVIAVVSAVPQIRPQSHVLVAALFMLMPFVIGTHSALGPLWSICVEELYYFLYPFLVSRRGVVFACICMIVVRLAIDIVLGVDFLPLYRFDAMAVGGLIAWLIQARPSTRAVLFKRGVGSTSFALSVALLFTRWPVHDLISGIVFSIFVAHVAFNPLFQLRWRSAEWLGQRSYGVYIWHYPVTVFVLSLGLPMSGIALVAFIIVATLLLSAVSYRVYESPFIRAKARFAAGSTQ